VKLPYARAAVALIVTSSFGAALTQLAGGCQGTPTVVPVRSLNGSGRVSFVCLSPTDPAELPLDYCNANQFTSICQYEYQDDAGNADAEVTYDDAGNPVATLLPHLYALVTQRTHGEVAVVDTSAIAGGVLNENPLEPGASFLPIGGNPTGIASTPGSVATFVGVAETGREGLFAIPSSRIRPAASWGVPDTCIGPGDASVVPPQLTSWPACHLPSAPGDVLLIDDPARPGAQGANSLQRLSCDLAYTEIDPNTQTIGFKEQFHGRPKIVFSLPDLGGIAVVDAQELLNRSPGSFDACTIERWVPLKVDLTGLAAQPAPLPTNACGNAAPQTLALANGYVAQPGGMSYANGKLYIADLAAPVIHVLELGDSIPGLGVVPTPCRMVEQAPLLPTSLDEPSRVVAVSRVSAAQVSTPNFKQYLYANDTNDPLGGSLMVFDIGPESTTRRPLERAHPEWNPFQPRDRVRFSAPAADIALVLRDIPAIDPVTGVAPSGVLCNNNPNAVTCIDTAHNCDLGTSYRTSTDYTTGAGPQKLRGEFAFAVLTNGKVAVIDVADFDAPCRGPVADGPLAGCATNASNVVTSAEVSCNVVAFDEPRGANYEAVGSQPGNHVPGIQTYPLLYAADGSVLASTSTTTAPRMVATLPSTYPQACLNPCDPLGCGVACDTLPGCPLEIFVGGQQTPIYIPNGQCAAAGPMGTQPGTVGTSNTLVMNLEDTRAQIADQDWTVSFEGAIPGFEQKLATLTLQTPTPVEATVTDPNSQFCDKGVLSERAFAEMLAFQPNQTTLTAAALADYVQITNDLPAATDAYWTEQTTCDYTTCLSAFGPIDEPSLYETRDLRIVEAYQDHVEVEQRHPPPPPPKNPMADAGAYRPIDMPLIACCFPGALAFTVRTGHQWAVAGSQTGFIHHVIADSTPGPTLGACRNACDPTLVRKNARLIETPATALGSAIPDRKVGEIDPSPAFLNPMFRFAIVAGSPATQRDSVFKFTTNGAFSPLLIGLATDSSLIEPYSATYLGATTELAVVDGALNGLIMVSLPTVGVSRSFY
jgi:hypothetical protein